MITSEAAVKYLLLSFVILLAGCTTPVFDPPTVTPVPTDTPEPTPTREYTLAGEWNVNCLEPDQQLQVQNVNPCLSLGVVKHIGDFVFIQPAWMETIPRANVYGEVGINMAYTAGITYYLGQGVPGTGRSWTGIVDVFTTPVEVEANVCHVALTYSYVDIWPTHIDPANAQIAQAYAVNVILYLDSPEEGREIRLNEQGLYEPIKRLGEADFMDMVGERTRLFPFWSRSDGYTVLPVHRFIGRYGLATPESTWTMQAFAILKTDDAGGQGLCAGIEGI